MRVLVMVRPQFPVPPEQAPALTQAFAGWRERYRADMEAFYFFAGSNGGCGIINVTDEVAFNQMMLEFPFAMVSTLEVLPLIDGDVALQQFQQFIATMAGGAPA